jgi:transcriptional regulator with XRE-family HTH domain
MVDAKAHEIDLNLFQELRNVDFRQQYFLAESSAQIAEQLIALRKRRGLSQKEVAEATGTQQPAISRTEQADYQNWSFNTLRKIAGALDARIRVSIEPSEDILGEYSGVTLDASPAYILAPQELANESVAPYQSALSSSNFAFNDLALGINEGSVLGSQANAIVSQAMGLCYYDATSLPFGNNMHFSITSPGKALCKTVFPGQPLSTMDHSKLIAQKDREIAKLKQKISDLERTLLFSNPMQNNQTPQMMAEVPINPLHGQNQRAFA